MNGHVYVGAGRRLIELIASIYRPYFDVDICDKGRGPVPRHWLGLCIRAIATGLRVTQGIISRETQHPSHSFEANGLIRNADSVGIN